MNLAPIILFAYNRPIHLKKTLTWLGNNELADQSTLFVFCDGIKPEASEEQRQRIAAVRTVAHEVAESSLFKEVHIIERDQNMGLGASIIAGVTDIINIYGNCIVLEDDLQTSPLFLDYMNKCLAHYEKRKSVFSISGLSRPHPERFYPKDYPYDVYVSLVHHPTGWGTWKDRWEQVDWEVRLFDSVKEYRPMIDAFRRIEYSEYDALIHQQKTMQNVWSVRFSFAHFVNHAVSICPIVSYINHIGWDSEATNAKGSNQWNFERLADKKDIRFLDVLYEDARIINSWYSFSIPQSRTLWGKAKNWIGRTFFKRDEFSLKGRVYV